MCMPVTATCLIVVPQSLFLLNRLQAWSLALTTFQNSPWGITFLAWNIDVHPPSVQTSVIVFPWSGYTMSLGLFVMCGLWTSADAGSSSSSGTFLSD
jgi:hypothetical protein